MKKILNKSLNFFGLNIKEINKANFICNNITQLESPIDSIYSNKYIVFEVPIEKCVYLTFLSYDPEGWHHFVKLLEQYRDGEATSYNNSILKIYYEKFQVKNPYDLYFDFPVNDLRKLCPKLKYLSLSNIFVQPWELINNEIFSENSKNISSEKNYLCGGNQACGPVSLQKGELEFNRLVKTYESIKKYGYLPSNSNDGEIRGYFLRKEDDYRFVIRAGLHRTAVLSALGYKKIRATFRRYHYREINIKEICNWPQVKNGLFEKNFAEMIFERFFQDNGIERAKNLGLLV